MSSYRIDCSPEKDILASRAVEVILENIQTALKKKERVQLALSGGSTPSVVYKLLSQENIPWQRVDVFLGDERWVDPNDSASNAFMLNRTLFSVSPLILLFISLTLSFLLNDPLLSTAIIVFLPF